MKLNLEALNPNQRAAVEWNKGPLLVLAGPGSGKTNVLTLRVAKLILDSPGKRFRILGLTFTSKAAAEMRNRIEDMVPNPSERCLLTTFHSFSADILRQHGSHLGIKPDFTILSEDADRESVLLDSLKELARGGVETERGDVSMLPLIDRIFASCVPDDKISSLFIDEDTAARVTNLFIEYRKQLVQANRMDFGSLLYFALQLLIHKPQVAKQIRTVYQHICVDEFQDTNLAQYQLLRAIVGEDAQNLFVVADDDQIIYQWNGASPERLRELRKDFAMSVIQLPANYRCPPRVIALANKLIRYNSDRSPEKEPLVAIKETEGPEVVRIRRFERMQEELDWVAKDIKQRPQAEWGECVVLARTRKLLEHAANALTASGLTPALVVRKNEFLSAPLKWLHAMLRLANTRADKEQVRRICKSFYDLEGIEIRPQDVIAFAPLLGGDFLRSWYQKASEREELSDTTRNFLQLSKTALADRLDFALFCKLAFSWFDALQKDSLQQGEDAFADYSNERTTWQELQAQTSNKYGDDLTLNILLQEFDLAPKSPPIPANAIRCFTIHSSKGLEFGHVYLIGMVEDQLPSYGAIKKGDRSHEMQEERRNCFVAITRTQISLTMTYAQEYFRWAKEPSRFLREMELIETDTESE
jgi:DNA helicase-2/ATP-dependent DNA helicase PcrA